MRYPYNEDHVQRLYHYGRMRRNVRTAFNRTYSQRTDHCRGRNGVGCGCGRGNRRHPYGRRNVFGTLIGCLLIQVISNSLNLLGVDSNWQKIAKGLVIIVAIILDQQGSRLLDKIRVRKVAQEA